MNTFTYYLSHPAGCRFARHPALIRVNNLLGTLRNDGSVSQTDQLIIQALLEILEDIQTYGPFTITTKASEKSEFITVFYDNLRVLAVKRIGHEINISYLRDSDWTWAEELCCLANAHAELVN